MQKFVCQFELSATELRTVYMYKVMKLYIKPELGAVSEL